AILLHAATIRSQIAKCQIGIKLANPSVLSLRHPLHTHKSLLSSCFNRVLFQPRLILLHLTPLPTLTPPPRKKAMSTESASRVDGPEKAKRSQRLVVGFDALGESTASLEKALEFACLVPQCHVEIVWVPPAAYVPDAPL